MAEAQIAVQWLPAEQQRAVECETAFQKGGPRVYVLEEDGRMLPSGMSAAMTLRYAFEGQVVYARRKVGTKYVWLSHPAA